MVVLPPIPKRIEALPRDERGYPVPWFVAWIDGKPEFRVADAPKFTAAIKQKLCWVCGQWLFKEQTFVVGPMYTITRTTAEPPCHQECAEFSAKACPFLTKPAACRREANLPEETIDAAGIMLRRNPGCVAIWDCHSRPYKLFDDGHGGVLFKIPDPDKVIWYAEGRPATRQEILASMNSGQPLLLSMSGCSADKVAKRELKKAREIAMQFVPA